MREKLMNFLAYLLCFYEKIYFLTFLIVAMIVALFLKTSPVAETNQPQILDNQAVNRNLPNVETNKIFQFPLDRETERVAKKPFGIFITPKNSPVQPERSERFSGYHTGVDFETFPDEQNKDIEIKAICNVNILLKRYVSGYGGAVVQACKFADQDITVIYGHLKISSLTITVGQELLAGDKIGVLGKGFSQETDYERKHLHLGIHLGKDINFLGYVQNKAELVNWLDVTKYFPK